MDAILGFDLSLTCVGWALISNSKILRFGSFMPVGSSKGEKLNVIYKEASKLIIEFEPRIVAIEEIFFSKWTAFAFPALCKAQAVMELVTHRLNRDVPVTARASEVRSSFDIDRPEVMKKEFLKLSKDLGYNKLSKAKRDKLYAEFKKNQIVLKVNSLYPNLLTNDQHDIADAILLSLYVESLNI